MSVEIPAADRLLGVIKRRGPQRISDLAAALRISAEAVRQQLARIAEDGLVEGGIERQGVGRPAQRWRLTRNGHARFPDTHPELTAQLIAALRSQLGEAALDRVIAARTAETAAQYRAALAGTKGLAKRVAALAALRDREGYMARSEPTGDGFLLLEDHCPICTAAATCQGFCRAEWDLFHDLLGPGVHVERIEHLLSGARRCAYRITPAG
jgi:predicted ArsR family transcriptional regulator